MSDDQIGNLLHEGAELYRGLSEASDVDAVLQGVWSLDERDLRRLALCTTMIAIQYEKGEDAFSAWWESNPRVHFVDED